jgi:hypothetical protein
LSPLESAADDADLLVDGMVRGSRLTMQLVKRMGCGIQKERNDDDDDDDENGRTAAAASPPCNPSTAQRSILSLHDILLDRRDGSKLERPDLVRNLASNCVLGSRATIILVVVPTARVLLLVVAVVVGNGWNNPGAVVAGLS